MTNEQLVTRIKHLTIALTLIVILLFFCVFKIFSQSISIDELTVKRVNIVGEDNNPRIVLSNEFRQHSGRMFGKDFPKRDRPAGIIFFNNEGTESGGIISAVYDKNGKVNSGMSFTMDRFNNDQVIQIINNEQYENGEEKIQRGFLVSEFPKGAKFFNLHNEYEEIKKIANKEIKREKTIDLLQREGAKKRIYLGKSFNNEAGLTLYDKLGKSRLKIFITGKGQPKIQYINDQNKTIDLIN